MSLISPLPMSFASSSQLESLCLPFVLISLKVTVLNVESKLDLYDWDESATEGIAPLISIGSVYASNGDLLIEDGCVLPMVIFFEGRETFLISRSSRSFRSPLIIMRSLFSGSSSSTL